MRLKQINGNVLEVPLTTSEETEHFSDPRNYTKEILDEWDSEPFYGIITERDQVILDIGANIGLFALHVMPYVYKIVCVEPTPKHMKVQKSLINSAGYSVGIFHEQSALNSYTGKARFRTEPVNTTMNALSDAGDSYEVDCITLKDLCDKYELTHVDLVKVDIEGSEYKAITTETVKAVYDIVDRFLLETHPRSRESMDYFKKIFENAGYKADYFDFNGSVLAYK